MSKELEERVASLIGLESAKKVASSAEYRAKKAYDTECTKVTAMLKSGHTLPDGSQYYAQIVDGEADRVNHKQAIDDFVEKYPQYSNVMQEMLEATRHRAVERLDYGLRPAAETPSAE